MNNVDINTNSTFSKAVRHTHTGQWGSYMELMWQWSVKHLFCVGTLCSWERACSEKILVARGWAAVCSICSSAALSDWKQTNYPHSFFSRSFHQHFLLSFGLWARSHWYNCSSPNISATAAVQQTSASFYVNFKVFCVCLFQHLL